MSSIAVAHPRLARWRRDLGPRLAGVVRQLESIVAPHDLLESGEIDVGAKRTRSMRIVGLISGVSVIAFLPALVVAQVPTELWPKSIGAVVLAVVVISWSLIGVLPGSRLVPIAVIADALVIALLGHIIGGYFHQIALLYALVVAGHTAIHGYRPALLMVALGGVLVPLAITSNIGLNATDIVYAAVYLFGIATIPWLYIRLSDRGVVALTDSARKYRSLVEHVPAIVYTAGSRSDGGWDYVSPRVQEFLGFPVEAWTNDPEFWLSRVHHDDRARMVEHWQDARTSEQASDAVEYRVVDAAGRVRWLRDEACLLDAGDARPQHWTGFLTDITDRKALEEQLQYQAFHDPLTGLPNRALFADRLAHALAWTDRRSETLAVLLLDIDDFKTVNDGIGHEAGDDLLVAVAKVLARSVRPMDTAARLGGDEFAILLEDLANPGDAQVAASRILKAFETPIKVAGREVVVTASIGIASPTESDADAAELMRNADAAMYAAKQQGKRRHMTFAPAMQEAVVRSLELAGEMRAGLEGGQFELHYQPVVRLTDEKIVGFEALLRWQHPSRGLIMPLEFVGEAEKNGQITAIGSWVLQQACEQAMVWQLACPEGCVPTMSVNVSARQFRDPHLIDSIRDALELSGLDPHLLILEITESTIMEDSTAAFERLERLKALGIRLAIDDFGTGYSSLSYLRRLPVDMLKVDKSFVDGIADGGQALALAQVIVSIGQTLRLRTVAEGVEQPAQAAALSRMGCDVAQGFHFGRPMTADDVVAALLSGERGHVTEALATVA